MVILLCRVVNFPIPVLRGAPALRGPETQTCAYDDQGGDREEQQDFLRGVGEGGGGWEI